MIGKRKKTSVEVSLDNGRGRGSEIDKELAEETLEVVEAVSVGEEFEEQERRQRDSGPGVGNRIIYQSMENPEWRTRYWDDSEVTQLLALWGDKSVQRELDGTRRDNQVFIKLSEDLSRRGIRRSPAQVREKIKILKREYRLCLGRASNAVAASTLIGPSGGKHILPGKFKYFEQMKEILGNTSASASAGQSPTNQSVPSPNETSSNENLSTCASSYLDYLQSYGNAGGTAKHHDAYDTKPLDLHVSSDAVNNLLRGSSPRENVVEGGGHRIYHYHRPISPKSYHKRPFSDVSQQVVGANRVSEESTDSEEGPTPEHKRSRYYNYETGTASTNNIKLREDVYLVQDILDRIFNYFRESDERFFQLEEKRMRHEKELEALRQDREIKLLDKLCHMTTELRRTCCQHCHKTFDETKKVKTNNSQQDDDLQKESHEPKNETTAAQKN